MLRLVRSCHYDSLGNNRLRRLKSSQSPSLRNNSLATGNGSRSILASFTEDIIIRPKAKATTSNCYFPELTCPKLSGCATKVQLANTLPNRKRWIRWVDVSIGTTGNRTSLVSADSAHSAVDTIGANRGSKGLCSRSYPEHHSSDGISISLVHTQSPPTDTYGY